MAKLELYIEKLLLLEGGYSNNQYDRGGVTNKGVTLKTWQKIGYDKDGDGDIDPDDLMRITNQDMVRIVRCFYWKRWRADEIESQPIAEFLVDWLWCSGKWGILIPQRILGVEPDGFVGPRTLEAVNHAHPADLMRKLYIQRIQFIRQIIRQDPTQLKFARGWSSRIRRLAFQLTILLLLTLLAGVSTSCSPERRLGKLLHSHPELLVADTVEISDTLTRLEVTTDTTLLISHLPDTVHLTRDRIEISLVKVHDTLYLKGKCKADTLIRTLRIPVEKIKMVKEQPRWNKPLLLLTLLTTLILSIILHLKTSKN